MAETREFIIPYPAQYESDVVLRDGSTLRFRPIRPDDAEALLALHDRLSRQSQKFRFFGLAASYAGEVSRLLRADHDSEFVLVAEAGKRLIGAATYVRDPAQVERAEVSFAIADALQGRGVGTRMLEMLASIARDHHIQTFEAYVLSDNDRMMRVFLDSGFEVQRRLEGGIFHVVLSLVPTARYEDTAAARSHAAATASMKTFFEPRTVAVIGANRERGKIGSEILHNLVAAASPASCLSFTRPPHRWRACRHFRR
jgi:RimJ/RimL family protein N-acetyltransferase